MIQEQIATFASSPFVLGAMMLLLNVGSRYIVHEFSDNDEEYSKNILLRRLTIFAVCFVGTRDLVNSIILTACFVVLASGFLRGKSTFATEGMSTNTDDDKMRIAAGLHGKVESPAYDTSVKPMF
jgi:hypothetical protein